MREAGGVVPESQNKAAGGAVFCGRMGNSGDGESVETASKHPQEGRCAASDGDRGTVARITTAQELPYVP